VRKTNINTNVNGDNFKNVMENDNLWIPTHCCHKTWITDLVSAFLETFQEVDFFASFVAVCRLKVCSSLVIRHQFKKSSFSDGILRTDSSPRPLYSFVCKRFRPDLSDFGTDQNFF
jgi:hypothetical protein